MISQNGNSNSNIDRKPRGFWSKEENILSVCRDFLKVHGKEYFNAKDLKRLGYGSLASAILRYTSWTKLREILEIHTETHPPGYWREKVNVINESKLFLNVHGVDSFQIYL